MSVDKGLPSDWVVVLNKLSYAGFKKDGIYRALDEKYGPSNWKAAHLLGSQVIDRQAAAELYGEAYFQHLQSHPKIADWLVRNAKEVYDYSPSNIDSGLDYSKQEGSATHLQDIAVRNALKRLGKEFKGTKLMQIRGHESDGYCLNPGVIPFHDPKAILNMEQRGWWKPGSVEDFYQKNKALLVRPSKFVARPTFVSLDSLIVEESEDQSYVISRGAQKSRIVRSITSKRARNLFSTDKSYAEILHAPTCSYEVLEQIAQAIITPEKRRIEFKDLLQSNFNVDFSYSILPLSQKDPFKVGSLGIPDLVPASYYAGIVSGYLDCCIRDSPGFQTSDTTGSSSDYFFEDNEQPGANLRIVPRVQETQKVLFKSSLFPLCERVYALLDVFTLLEQKQWRSSSIKPPGEMVCVVNIVGDPSKFSFYETHSHYYFEFQHGIKKVVAEIAEK